MFSTTPRSTKTLAGSGRVQWSRCTGGDSQASASSRQICSAVNRPGHSGRGRSANSVPIAPRRRLGRASSLSRSVAPSSQRLRHNPTVSSHSPLSWAMALFVRPSPAARTVFARSTRPCGISRLPTMVCRRALWARERMIGGIGRAICICKSINYPIYFEMAALVLPDRSRL